MSLPGAVPVAKRAAFRGSLPQPATLPGSSSSALLLDTYPGAVAAYSLRKLRTAYSGAAIRVRRSLDNAEADIGFSGNALDTSALLAHVGAGDGFVAKWYDQVGSVDVVSTTAARQRQIVSGGSVITSGGLPCLARLGDAYGGMWSTETLTQAQPFHVFTVFGTPSTLPSFHSGIVDTDGVRIAYYSAAWRIDCGTSLKKNDYPATDTRYLWSVLANGGSTVCRGNEELLELNGSDPGSNGIDGTIGIFGSYYNLTSGVPGYAQEVIIFGADKSGEQSELETAINDYWGVY